MQKDFNKEIKKYPVYYLEERYDSAGNRLAPHIKRAYRVLRVKDYNHYELELHHAVPFTDWEKNTKNVRSYVNQRLILLPKKMHQHLENPVYRLSKADFERVYKINPDKILFDINSKMPRTADLFSEGVNFGVLAENPFKEEECA